MSMQYNDNMKKKLLRKQNYFPGLDLSSKPAAHGSPSPLHLLLREQSGPLNQSHNGNVFKLIYF